MSGRDLVDEMRSGVRPLTPPRQGGALDLVVGVVAVIAVISLAFFGYKFWFSGGVPQPPAAVQVAAVTRAATRVTPAAWTKADDDACMALGQAAARNPQTGNYVITNYSISEGVAFLVTKTECQLTRKTTRFCGTDGKSKLVAIVNDYLGRMDLVVLGIGAQGAPMAVAGAIFGGEPAAGDGIYQDMAKDTLDYMASYNTHVLKAVRTLAKEGVVTADDFNTGPFGGVPENIQKIFAGVTATGNICA
jgi:hypothetical protein